MRTTDPHDLLRSRKDRHTPSRKRNLKLATLTLNLTRDRLNLLLSRKIALHLLSTDDSQLRRRLALNLNLHTLLSRAIVRHLDEESLPATSAARNPIHRPKTRVRLHSVDLVASVRRKHLLHEIADRARNSVRRIIAKQVRRPIAQTEVLEHRRERRSTHDVAVALEADGVDGLADGADHGRVVGGRAVVVGRAAVLADDDGLRARLVVEGAEVADELVGREVLVDVLEDAFGEVLDDARGAVLLGRRRDDLQLRVFGVDGVVVLFEARGVGVAAIVEEVFVADFDEGDVEGAGVAERGAVLSAWRAGVAKQKLKRASVSMRCSLRISIDSPRARPWSPGRKAPTQPRARPCRHRS